MTHSAGGDEAAALCNATGGNLLGVLATPLLLAVLLGTHVELPLGRILGQLALDVLAPLALGQLAQLVGGAALARRCQPLKPFSSLAIIFIVFTVSCGMFSSHDLSTLGHSALIVMAAVVLMHAALLAVSWWSSGLIGLARGERIAVLFCASQKTLAIGAPLVAIVHPDPADLALAMLPMVAYHPVQLLADGIIAARLKTAEPAGQGGFR
jgi:sodium/bile acid cotransporter 7